MKLTRFLRDAFVLVGFCAAFYFLTIYVGRLDRNANDNSDFSAARKRADMLVRNQDWTSAAEEFKKLTEQDPYNGRAWFMYASSFYNQRNDALQEIFQLKQSPNPDGARIARLEKDAERYEARAEELYHKSQEFARYRNSSLVRLSVFKCSQGSFDKALEYLDGFVDNGGYTQAGLAPPRRRLSRLQRRVGVRFRAHAVGDTPGNAVYPGRELRGVLKPLSRCPDDE